MPYKNKKSAGKFKFRLAALVLAVGLLGGAAAYGFGRSATAATSGCATPPDFGTDTTTVSVPATGTYTVWSRILAPDATNNSYSLDIDGANCFTVGDYAIPANTWTWVSYQNGDQSNKIALSLTAGNHAFKLIGREPGVKVDRVIITTDAGCTAPTGTGNNCTTAADATPPTVSLTSPSDGATVSGTINVTANASDNVAVTKVEFYIDNTLTKTITTASSYAYSWNTAGGANGSHTILAKAYDAAGNTSTSAATVTVKNGDTQAPSTPGGLQASASAANKVAVSWQASTDNVGVTGYILIRNGVVIDTPATTSYSDSNVVPGTTYSYQVQAVDAAGNKSALSAAASVTTPQAADTQAPSTPGGLTAVPVSPSQVNLSWQASTDNVGVTGYDVYRTVTGGAATKVATATGTQFGDTGLSAGTQYTYYVVAKDQAGNTSAHSASVLVTTLQQPPKPVATGTFRGVVSDNNGQPLANVRVSLWSNGAQYDASTNGSGVYRFDQVPAGIYTATYSASHYQTVQRQVTIKADTNTVRDVQLTKIGQHHHWWEFWRR